MTYDQGHVLIILACVVVVQLCGVLVRLVEIFGLMKAETERDDG